VYSRSSSHQDKNAVAAGVGAHYIAAEEVGVDDMAKQVGAIDVVYEAMGASNVAFQVIPKLGANAVFVFTGVPGRKGPIEVPTDIIMRDMVLNNQMIFGTVNAAPESFTNAIRHLAVFRQRWPNALGKVITGRFPIEQAPELLTGNSGGIKNVVAIAQ
jgi:threonine dehydrogenase-like Zn-dependent dehydrogenase